MKSFFLTLFLFILKSASVPAAEPTLKDLFEGRAFFQPIEKSQTLTVNGGYMPAFEQKKMQLLPLPQGGAFSIIRAFHQFSITGAISYQLFPFITTDGLTMNKAGADPLFANYSEFRDWNFYDAHIAYNPLDKKYILAIECTAPNMLASLCVSTSTTPNIASSWSIPTVLIRGQNGKSASTGIIIPFAQWYLVKWTIVDDGNAPWSEGFESASTYALLTHDLSRELGPADQIGKPLLEAEKNIFCYSRWDCNNRDAIDWVFSENYYYMIYHGANFYRDHRNPHEAGTVSWHVGLSRSYKDPLGNYSMMKKPIIYSQRSDGIGIAYPTLNKVNGATYMYYYSQTANDSTNRPRRSRLVWAAQKNWSIKETCDTFLPDLFLPAAQGSMPAKIRGAYCLLYDRDATATEIKNWTDWKNNNPSVKSLDLHYAMVQDQASFKNRWQVAQRSRTDLIFLAFARILRRPPSNAELGYFNDNLPQDPTAFYNILFAQILSGAEFQYSFGPLRF